MGTQRTCRFFVASAILAMICAGIGFAGAQSGKKSPATIAGQLSTEERLRGTGWWPTKSTFQRDDFVGAPACARCHAELASSQSESAMAQTATLAGDSQILRTNPLDYHLGPFSYRISEHGDNVDYSVGDGTRSITGPLTWSFGIRMGQSYFFNYHDQMYLVPLTYYPEPKAFGFTVDQPHTVPDSLEKAVGRPLKAEEIRGCFDCHTTAATTNGGFEPRQSLPGVTCEACHGPGAQHSAAEKGGFLDMGAAAIFNPRYLKPVDAVDFCGSCHRSWWDVVLGGMVGLKSLRFQPYRIENSRCWGNGDARITCIACHDPHKPLVRVAAPYDKNCLSCHVNSPGAKPTPDHPGASCKVETKNCVSCHMPQYTVIDIPVKFTDHQIRVVRPNEPVPE